VEQLAIVCLHAPEYIDKNQFDKLKNANLAEQNDDEDN
jgi:hypothetical protein